MTTRRIAAIFAHPDDETFAVGGTLARYATDGASCDLFCATDGSGGRASGVPIASRDELGELRKAELVSACRVLGIGAVRHGGYRDGELERADTDRLVGEIVAFLRERRPDVVLTFGPEGAPTGHPDHRAISRAATAAFFLAGNPTAYAEQLGGERRAHAPSRLYYVTWDWEPAAEGLPMRGLPISARVDVRACLKKKHDAFLAHRTQRELEPRFEQVAMRDREFYHLAAGAAQPAPLVEDLFAGL